MPSRVHNKNRKVCIVDEDTEALGEVERPQVSIIISTWNCRSQIEKCLESLELQQSPYTFEVIVVDQGSDDGTWEYVSRVKTAYLIRRIRLVKNRTWSFANRLGINIADGEWIALSNPDISFPIDFLSNLIKGAEAYPGYVIGCHCVAPDGKDLHPMNRLTPSAIFHVCSHRTLGVIIDRKLCRRFFERSFIMPVPTRDTIVGHLNAHFMLLHRFVLEEVGLWDERLRWACGDSDLLRKAEEKGHRQMWLHDAILVHEGEYTRKKTTKRLYEYEYAYGYKIYSKIWKLRAIPILFILDALTAPLILWIARQASLRSQIQCSAAKIQGLLA